MNISLAVLHRFTQRRASRRAFVMVALVVAVIGTAIAVVGLRRAVDGEQLRTIAQVASGRWPDAALAAAAFVAAFFVRAWLWSRMVNGLGIGHALSSIAVATGANHVVPFRLGEPLRVVSVVHRTGMNAGDATTSTVALRTGDVIALLVIGMLVSPALVVDALGWWGLAIILVLVMLAAFTGRFLADAIRMGRLRRPDVITVVGTFGAWLLEAVLVWRIAVWAGADLGYHEATLVGAIAVAAQLVAITPGGVGTYEAAAIAALVASGVPATEAATIAVAVHAAKTILSVVGGLIALWVPAPGLFGRLRLPRHIAAHAPVGDPAPDGPVVLFTPAFNESPRVASVVARAPAQVCGRPVIFVVVDDGSTDDTVEVARRCGVSVVEHGTNRGLGAAVATGLATAVEMGAAVVAFCDADGEYDPAELEALVAPILVGDADYVVGSRFIGTIEHMRPHRRFGNIVLTKWVAWTSRLPITDGQSGYRALSRVAASKTVSAHDYNYAQVLTLDLAGRGFRYKEVPINYRFRQSGDSFVKLGRYLRRCIPAAWRVVNNRLT